MLLLWHILPLTLRLLTFAVAPAPALAPAVALASACIALAVAPALAQAPALAVTPALVPALALASEPPNSIQVLSDADGFRVI